MSEKCPTKFPKKCPQCGNEEIWSQVDEGPQIGIYWYCDNCQWESGTLFVVAAAELLDLIEKAIEYQWQHRDNIRLARRFALKAVESAMKGDPSALKRLAGVEE